MWRAGYRGADADFAGVHVDDFFVLEYGNIAYHTIIANHASYEFARIGSLVAVKKPSGRPDRTIITQKINQAKQKVFGSKAGGIGVSVKVETTGTDPMYKRHRHEDVVVTVNYPVRLIFRAPALCWPASPAGRASAGLRPLPGCRLKKPI